MQSSCVLLYENSISVIGMPATDPAFSRRACACPPTDLCIRRSSSATSTAAYPWVAAWCSAVKTSTVGRADEALAETAPRCTGTRSRGRSRRRAGAARPPKGRRPRPRRATAASPPREARTPPCKRRGHHGAPQPVHVAGVDREGREHQQPAVALDQPLELGTALVGLALLLPTRHRLGQRVLEQRPGAPGRRVSEHRSVNGCCSEYAGPWAALLRADRCTCNAALSRRARAHARRNVRPVCRHSIPN